LIRFTDSVSEADLYVYAAKVVSIYDGDTIRVDIDLGLYVVLRDQRLRLYGIDTPEIRGPERPRGLQARKEVEKLIAEQNGEILIRTYKDKTGKYGRWLAEVFAGGININRRLIECGLARLVEY